MGQGGLWDLGVGAHLLKKVDVLLVVWATRVAQHLIKMVCIWVKHALGIIYVCTFKYIHTG
jgi:hypothetical protein